jgi:hypothetical protein
MVAWLHGCMVAWLHVHEIEESASQVRATLNDKFARAARERQRYCENSAVVPMVEAVAVAVAVMHLVVVAVIVAWASAKAAAAAAAAVVVGGSGND